MCIYRYRSDKRCGLSPSCGWCCVLCCSSCFWARVALPNRICFLATRGRRVDVLQGKPSGSVREGTETFDDQQAPASIYCFLSDCSHLLTCAGIDGNQNGIYTSTRYSFAPHNDNSVNDGPHIRRWPHIIFIVINWNWVVSRQYKQKKWGDIHINQTIQKTQKTPKQIILSTDYHLLISKKALGTLPEDGNVIPKHVGATIHN
jgi:hypothetical protein